MQIKTVIIQLFVMKVKRFNSIKGKLVVKRCYSDPFNRLHN